MITKYKYFLLFVTVHATSILYSQKLINTIIIDTTQFELDTTSFEENSFIFICPLNEGTEAQYQKNISELLINLIDLKLKNKVHFLLSCKDGKLNNCVLNKLNYNVESNSFMRFNLFKCYYFSRNSELLIRCHKKLKNFEMKQSKFSNYFFEIDIAKCPEITPDKVPIFSEIIMETLQPNFSDSEKITNLEKQNIQLSNDLRNTKSLLESANETIKNQDKRINRLEVLLDTLHSSKIKSLEQENYQAPSKGEYVFPEKKKKESLLNKLKFAKKEKNGSKD